MSNASEQVSTHSSVALDKFFYDNKIVKWFAYATIIWGLAGMLFGLWAALQLVFPALNFSTAETTFGRVRPVHTNAVIFAFVGNG
ncbi:MAG: cbb3-type cytochrome c oxidase subunit I, partial [Taibaiella sp.]|nr:cbb3-type cytochrome c oxidase subunit I [Taibaiella sp.]